MEQILVFDSNHNPSRESYEKLNEEDRVIVDKFEKYCLVSANLTRAKKSKSNAVRFLIMVNKKLNDVNLEDLQNFLMILNKSNFSDYYKNDVKGFIQRFLKWHFKDWSQRFNNFEDVKFISDPQRTKKINPEDVLSKEQVEKLVKAEPDIFWKAFIICQYEGALRTIETRTLKWDMIDMEDPDVYWLTIKSKKNKNATEKERPAPPLSQSIYFLNELKKLQLETNHKSPYVFPSRHDLNSPISSGTVNKWFFRLTKKVLGKSIKNYLLRHSEGEELHKLIRAGKLSKENACLMMGHSEKMFDKTYSHTNKKELLKLIKKQILNVDYIAPEKRHKLELQMEALKKKLELEIEERKKSEEEKTKKQKEINWDNMVINRMLTNPAVIPKIIKSMERMLKERKQEEKLKAKAR